MCVGEEVSDVKRFSSKWLSVKAKKALREHSNRTIRENLANAGRGFRSFLKGTRSWQLLLPLVCASFALCYLNLPLPNWFLLSGQEAIEILHNRLSDLVGVFGVSVAVAVFVVSALQARRSGEEQFSTVFVESWLYPILYSILSAIGVMAWISYRRNDIPDEVFLRMVAVGYFCFTLALLSVAVLFERIFRFIQTDFLLKRYLSSVEHEAENALEAEFEGRVSRRLYQTHLEGLGLNQNYFEPEKKDASIFRVGFPWNARIKDVNLRVIAKTLRKLQQKRGSSLSSIGSFKALGLDDFIRQDESVMWLSCDGIAGARRLRDKLQNAYKATRIRGETRSTSYEEEKQRLKSRLIKVVMENDVVAIEHILEAYTTINRSFATKSKAYRIEANLQNLPSRGWFEDEWDVLREIDRHILIAFEKAVELSNREIVLDLCGHVYHLLVMSMHEDSLILFRKYYYLPTRLYYLTRKSEELKRSAANLLASYWTNLIRLHISYEYRDAREIAQKQRLNQFYYLAFTGFNALFKTMIDLRDFAGFKTALNQFSQLDEKYHDPSEETQREILKVELSGMTAEEKQVLLSKLRNYLSVESQPIEMYNAVQFGLQSWLWYLFRCNIISGDQLSHFGENVKLAAKSQADKVNQLISTTEGERDLFGWGEWDTQERPLVGEYSPLQPRTWLTFGFVVWAVRDGGIQSTNLDKVDNSEMFLYRYDEISLACDFLARDFERCRPILGNISREDFDKRLFSLKDLFGNLKMRIEHSIATDRVRQGLSQPRIEEFRQKVGDAWHNSGNIRRLFEIKNAIDVVDNNAVELPACVANVNLIGGKMMFVDDRHETIYGIESTGSEISLCEDNSFFLMLMKSIKKPLQFGTAAEAVKSMSRVRTDKGLTSDIIMMHRDLLWRSESLMKCEDFTPAWRAKPPIQKPFDGTFGEIPVVGVNNELFESTILVADFSTAFRMRQKRDPNWYESQLKVEVKEIDDTEAVRILEEKPNEWLRDSKGNPVDRDHALFKIKQGILLFVATYLDYSINDHQGYETANVSEQRD